MPAKTPVTTRSTAGYVIPEQGVYGGVNAVSASLITNGTLHSNDKDLKLKKYFFSDIDTGDTWASGIQGAVACAWQTDQADADLGGVSITTVKSTATPFGAIFTFDVENANSVGWLWVLSRE
jgi:hypothetical protein